MITKDNQLQCDGCGEAIKSLLPHEISAPQMIFEAVRFRLLSHASEEEEMTALHLCEVCTRATLAWMIGMDPLELSDQCYRAIMAVNQLLPEGNAARKGTPIR